jgi:hypothetical protein
METLSLIMSNGLTNSSSRHADLPLRPFRDGFSHPAVEMLRMNGNVPATWLDASPELDSVHAICDNNRRTTKILYQLASKLPTSRGVTEVKEVG